MRPRGNYTNEEVIEFIEQNFAEGIPVSLREIARHFNTSHSQIKRILLKENYYDEYLRKKEDLLNSVDENEEENVLCNIDRKPKIPMDYREVNVSIDIDEEDVSYILEFEKKKREKLYEFFKPETKVGFISDVHLGHHSQESINLALSYLKAMGIDILILGGDILDFESISFWKNKGTLSVSEEIELGREFIKELREFFGDKLEIYWLEGNHCNRLERYILSKADKLYDLEDLRLPYLLRLKEYNVKWINTKEHIQKHGEPFRIGKLNFLHGHEIRASFNVVNVARTLYLKAQDNLIFGHFHTTQEYIQKNIRGDVKGAWAVGCLCDLSPDYAPVNNWNHGFAYIEFDKDGNFIIHNKKIVNGLIL